MKKVNVWAKFLTLLTIILLPVLAGCQSAPAQSPTPTVIPSPTVSSSSPTATPTPPSFTIKIASKASLGDYLTDAKGMTLYYFTKDTVGKSTATGAVLANWPIFNAAGFVVPTPLNAANFGTITRDDGLKQTTYQGWPLYYYINDKASGDTLGQSLNNVWFVINPANFPPPSTLVSPLPSATATAPVAGVTIDLIAQGFAFDKKTITVPAGANVLIRFNNKDSAPHNFALYQDGTAAKSVFIGNVITSSTTDYKFTAPATPGTYFFRCDLHPSVMTGSFIVQ